MKHRVLLLFLPSWENRREKKTFKSIKLKSSRCKTYIRCPWVLSIPCESGIGKLQPLHNSWLLCTTNAMNFLLPHNWYNFIVKWKEKSKSRWQFYDTLNCSLFLCCCCRSAPSRSSRSNDLQIRFHRRAMRNNDERNIKNLLVDTFYVPLRG